MLSKLHGENPFSIVISGDFNCRSTQWWENDIENNEGKLLEPVVSDLGLHQLISEPTHLRGDSKSCIDLIRTDQPNLVVESGVHPSQHAHCHHQIVYGKLTVSNITQPSYTRKIWYYDRADFVAIMKSIKVPLQRFFDFTSLDRSKYADFENEKFFAIRGVFVEVGAVLYPIVVLHEQSGNEPISDVIVVRRMPTTIT